ncbi:MAG: sulfite exporter TauE/SafE family protein [Solirubrobacterales bacterium]
MSAFEVILVLVAGFGAGTINAVIGSGTLITFPVLLAIGLPPVTANVSNNLGLVPGAASSLYGYREELEGERGRVLRLAPMTVAGSACGAALLLLLPPGSFKAIVPVLIAIALVLVVLQPRISAYLTARREVHRPHGGPMVRLGVFGVGIYGGYFGGGQGIILFALLANSLPGKLLSINVVRAALTGVANATAAVIFVFAADLDWLVVLLIAVGSTVGGLIGAGIGKRIPDPVLRATIVVVGLAAIAQLVL